MFVRSPLNVIQFDAERQNSSTRIVYFGVGLAGKGSNLQVLARMRRLSSISWSQPFESKSETTIWYDRLRLLHGQSQQPVDCYTLTGRIANPSAWTMLLSAAHIVVFVVDSQIERLEANAEMAVFLDEWFELRGGPVPIVVQYNKRDLPNAGSIVELSDVLNRHVSPEIEAVASRGKGIQETLDAALNGLRR